MLKKLLISAVAGAATMIAVTAAQAATTFDFTSGNTGWTTGSIGYSSGGISLNVSAGRYVGDNVIDSGSIRQYDGFGLAVNSEGGDENHAIDGKWRNDVVQTSFDQDVYFNSVSFTFYDQTKWFPFIGDILYDPDSFAFFFDTDSDGELELINPALDGNPFEFTGGILKAGTLFGIGAIGKHDDFKLASITVTAVPLPPALALFGGAVLGLGWLARRRKTQS